MTQLPVVALANGATPGNGGAVIQPVAQNQPVTVQPVEDKTFKNLVVITCLAVTLASVLFVAVVAFWIQDARNKEQFEKLKMFVQLYSHNHDQPVAVQPVQPVQPNYIPPAAWSGINDGNAFP